MAGALVVWTLILQLLAWKARTSNGDLRQQYIGCYADGGVYYRSMGQPPFINESLTLESCLQRCQTSSFTVFGVEYFHECYCSDTFDRLGPSNNCNTTCGGNRNQICGGDKAISVYSVCPVGFYSSNCTAPCGHCYNHSSYGAARCFRNGSCPAGCQPGWSGRRCKTDNDECVPGDKCSENCTNTPGSYYCSCTTAGFQLAADRKTCIDTDECSTTATHGCQHNCTNTVGGYFCSCHDGFTLDANNKTCSDIDECLIDNGGCSLTCVNTVGGYNCTTCRPGFELVNASRCEDVDECLSNNGGCEQNCSNTVGSHQCSCATGYVLHENQLNCAVQGEGLFRFLSIASDSVGVTVFALSALAGLTIVVLLIVTVKYFKLRSRWRSTRRAEPVNVARASEETRSNAVTSGRYHMSLCYDDIDAKAVDARTNNNNYNNINNYSDNATSPTATTTTTTAVETPATATSSRRPPSQYYEDIGNAADGDKIQAKKDTSVVVGKESEKSPTKCGFLDIKQSNRTNTWRKGGVGAQAAVATTTPLTTTTTTGPGRAESGLYDVVDERKVGGNASVQQVKTSTPRNGKAAGAVEERKDKGASQVYDEIAGSNNVKPERDLVKEATRARLEATLLKKPPKLPAAGGTTKTKTGCEEPVEKACATDDEEMASQMYEEVSSIEAMTAAFKTKLKTCPEKMVPPAGKSKSTESLNVEVSSGKIKSSKPSTPKSGRKAPKGDVTKDVELYYNDADSLKVPAVVLKPKPETAGKPTVSISPQREAYLPMNFAVDKQNTLKSSAAAAGCKKLPGNDAVPMQQNSEYVGMEVQKNDAETEYTNVAAGDADAVDDDVAQFYEDVAGRFDKKDYGEDETLPYEELYEEVNVNARVAKPEAVAVDGKRGKNNQQATDAGSIQRGNSAETPTDASCAVSDASVYYDFGARSGDSTALDSTLERAARSAPMRPAVAHKPKPTVTK